ncbi:MAG: XRE family transcriptional regulator [Deltaproteobacteria bacterium]|nr:XRE family transcriptional regulator [Deltaproteobacteria bacterium]
MFSIFSFRNPDIIEFQYITKKFSNINISPAYDVVCTVPYIFRDKPALTQQETAIKAGISRPTLSRMEQGKFANVSVRALFIILDTLDYKIEIIAKNSIDLPVLKQKYN